VKVGKILLEYPLSISENRVVKFLLFDMLCGCWLVVRVVFVRCRGRTCVFVGKIHGSIKHNTKLCDWYKIK
jgi:hypothetical protein